MHNLFYLHVAWKKKIFPLEYFFSIGEQILRLRDITQFT